MALKAALQGLLDGSCSLPGSTIRKLAEIRPYRNGSRIKRDGTIRPIAEPGPLLRRVQDYLVEHVWGGLQVHDAAHGYVESRSIVTHAAIHTSPLVLVTMDIADFFGRVTEPRVAELLIAAGSRAAPAQLAAALCTRSPAGSPAVPVLPQGAPTSPGLANAAFFWVDCALRELARGLGFDYSRYVDDLAFSMSNGTRRIAEPAISGLCAGAGVALCAAGFALNRTKTRVRWFYERQEITGLVVNSAPGKPPVRAPRERWRTMRAAMTNVAKNGASKKKLEELHGMASFLAMTDPGRAEQYLEPLALLMKWSDFDER